MYRHTPVCFRGPFTRIRAWWKFPPPLEQKSADEALLALHSGAVALEEVRSDLVARIRREIAEGKYDTPEKWDAALRRLFGRLEQP